MPPITDEIKTFIVKGLACFDTPSEVADSVMSTFNVEVTRQQVHRYDPACTQPPAPRWRELHAATRRTHLAQLAEIGVAHRTFRLKLLDRMVHDALALNKFALTASILEQAAMECGGMYDRKRYPRAAANHLGAADPTP